MKPHALIVDDSLTVRMELRSVLTSAGFAVTACETKAHAQSAMRQRTFSLLVLDIVLPDGDGIDFLKELRTTAEHGRMPVILLSSEADVWRRITALRSGADEYISKPYDSAFLTRRARELAGLQAHNV